MGKLSAAGRRSLPNSAFAGPDRSFPIEDRGHAQAALGRSGNAPDPDAIKAAVYRRYPDMKGASAKASRGQMRDDATHSALMRNLK